MLELTPIKNLPVMGGFFYKLKTSKMKNDFKFLKGQKEIILCCFCGVELTDRGNNPDPIVVDNPTDKCCDTCNMEKVVPGRIFLQQRGLRRPFIN